MIDLNSVVAFFHKAKWSELALRYEIYCVLGENAVNYSTAGKDVRAFACASRRPDSLIVGQSESDFSRDDGIACVLSEEPFLSVHQIDKKAAMSKSTGNRHLTQRMQWKPRHLE
jgi:hypothetical protein